MEYSLTYKKTKRSYIRVREGKIFVTLSIYDLYPQKTLNKLLDYAPKLLENREKKQKIRALWDQGTTIFGEEISWEELGLKHRTMITREKYLKKMLLEYTEELVYKYVQQLSEFVGKKYICKSVKIKKMKAKWWYCTSKQDIVFALQLLHLPNAWIRYVVIHEVCHLREKNHSPKFWSLVEQLCPEYKKIKKEMGNIRLD